jgi:DNA/RNA-binding domain of Phe-tRNA-synthetase-like protein
MLHTSWLILAITLGVWTAQQFILNGPVSRLLDQSYVALLVAALWPEHQERHLQQAIKAAKKAMRRWSTGIPLPS